MNIDNKIKKSTEGLREVLFQELEGFLNGTYDSEHVKAVTKVTNSILATVTKDLEAAKLIHEFNQGKDQPKTIADLHLNLMLTTSNDDKTGA